MTTYILVTDWGREPLQATTIVQALTEAEELLRAGDYGDAGGWVVGYVHRCVEGRSTQTERIEFWLEPNHAALIAAAGGSRNCPHEWTSDGEGGLAENPGVYGIGGAAIMARDHCRFCGVRRETISGDTNPPDSGNRDGTTYFRPRSEEDYDD